jgi:putative cell wall-binding protein
VLIFVLIEDDLFIFDDRWKHYDESESQYLIESMIQENSEINDKMKMKIQWDEIMMKKKWNETSRKWDDISERWDESLKEEDEKFWKK